MRAYCSFASVIAILLAVPAAAQESLCNPCVDPGPDRIRRSDFVSPSNTIIVTADDMRNLGVVSVADMVRQLPSNVAEPDTTPANPPSGRSPSALADSFLGPAEPESAAPAPAGREAESDDVPPRLNDPAPDASAAEAPRRSP